ncbi:hypothetical protein [Anaerorhabdus furcosa]|uniref:Membrane-spanning protein n=1 Tax=Anaerorhabdus furcosa TaxID=118967 RepID=A0A1T4KIZ6_9FIRM|nr:hypothetical protein [Anaerorhabdus furcosa]SJZ42371.1 hypothetical protein SAMN02745191_0558 [Anaerorhabdus furcosa]
MKKLKELNWEKFIFIFVMASLIISTVFIGYKMIVAPATIEAGMEYARVKSDYTLMFFQCLLGIVAMVLPSIFEKRFKVIIPSYMLILYVIFLYCAIFLGEVRSYYYTVNHWDTILHTFSGGMLGALGFSFVSLLNQSEKVPMNLSPLFVAIFAFCFAITLGVIWEIYEFTFDGVLGLNMQKFMLEDGTQLIGRAALMDTMKDLIVDAAGALVVSVIGYVSMKTQKDWLQKVQFKRAHLK